MSLRLVGAPDEYVCLALASYGLDRTLYGRAINLVATAQNMKPVVLHDAVMVVRNATTRAELRKRFMEIRKRRGLANE